MSFPRSRIPWATELRKQQEAGEAAEAAFPRQGQATRQLAGLCGRATSSRRAAEPAASSPPPTRSPKPRSPVVSHPAKLGLRVPGIVVPQARPRDFHVFPSRRKWVTGRWGTLTLATPTPWKAARTAPPLLCQRLQTAQPAGIREDSNATSPRPGG